MFLPIGDSPNLPRTPWVTRALIVINVLVHLALWPLAFEPADPTDPATRQYLQVLAEALADVPRSPGARVLALEPARRRIEGAP